MRSNFEITQIDNTTRMKNLHTLQEPKCLIASVALVLCVAIGMRLLWVFCVGVEPVSDGVMYREFAQSIATGAGYAYPDGQLTVYWAVGASAFYAVLKHLFGFSEWPIVLANLAIGVGVVWLTYLIALRYFDEFVANKAAWIVALWPVLIQFTTVYASELLFIFLLLTALYVWGANAGSALVRAVIWGALLCGAVYVRPTAMPLFFALPTVYLLSTKDIKGAVVSLCVAVLTAGLFLAPWVLRNQQVFGSPVLVSANFGGNLWMGNNPQSTGAYMPLPDIYFADEIARDQYFKAQAMEFIKANPLEYAKLAIRRVVVTYDRETIGVAWNEPALRRVVGERGLTVVKAISTGFWWLVVVFALVGIAWAFWRRRVGLFNPLLVVMGAFFIVPVLTVGQDRYHLPLNPFLAIFAAYAMHMLSQRLGNYKKTR